MDKRMNENEIAFLDHVTEKLKEKIDELNQGISDGEKEIADMHEYYWENYTEMDEYGYENFDNQQALFQQVTANQEKQKMRHRLERMVDSPYFGRVDFAYEGETQPETFYIGIGNFAERPGALPLIYDWRAPVSSLFYDYDKGVASYEAPGGVVEGEIWQKWQYKIRGGNLVYAFESDVKIDDEILKQELGSHGDVQLKNIVCTIQKEQNAIIRNRSDKILVIQGVAGSGKTSVALHRIAYLLYHDRKNLKSSNVLVLSPNGVFSDYIFHILPELGEENIKEMSFDLFAYRELHDVVKSSNVLVLSPNGVFSDYIFHILPELGEENIKEMSFDLFAYRELHDVVSDCEDRYHQLERNIHNAKTKSSEQTGRWKEKQSQWMVGQMEGFLAELEDRMMNFKKVEWRNMEKSEQEMIRLFYFQFSHLPLMNRMEAIMEHFIDEYETLYGCEISEEDQKILENKFLGMYETRDLYEIYNWFLESLGYEKLLDVPYEKRVLAYEDVFPMLYLKYRLFGKKQQKRIRHLVIDEMQDYSYLQYVILNMLFPCNMTILGDWAQTMDDEVQDVKQFLPKIFGKGIRMIEMKKSYRNTWEIANYAASLVHTDTKELLERHGKSVEEHVVFNKEEALSSIGERLHLDGAMETAAILTMTEADAWSIYQKVKGLGWEASYLDRALSSIGERLHLDGAMETAAILTMTEADAWSIYQKVKGLGWEASYLDRDSSSFKKGLVITTFYLAKGLEFDQVFAVMPMASASMENDGIYRQANYICATRALHELYMYQYEEKEDSYAL